VEKGSVSFSSSVAAHAQCVIMELGLPDGLLYEGWNFNSGNYLFTTDTK